MSAVDLNIDGLDKGGNNKLHINGKKNFQQCLKTIIESISCRAKLDEMLLHKNANGNNPMMSCVFKNSEKSLDYLLGLLHAMKSTELNREVIFNILHEPNSKNDTLLSLILHYQYGAMISQSIALKLEQCCHLDTPNKSHNMKDLTTCLRNNTKASFEVSNAIKNVEDTYEKTTKEKILIWLSLFWSSFLMPIGVMVSDMSFDIILVIGYGCYLFMANDMITSSSTNSAQCSDVTIFNSNYNVSIHPTLPTTKSPYLFTSSNVSTAAISLFQKIGLFSSISGS